MIQKRSPKSAENLKQLEKEFIGSAEKLSLKSLSLDDLANRYEDIEQQSQLIQGQILLEARSRFTNTNAFGAWIQEQGGALCAVGAQHRTRLMNLATFFSGKTMEGISVTAAYEISAPINASVAESIYSYAVFKNMPVAEVKKMIANAKCETLPIPIKPEPPVIQKPELPVIESSSVNHQQSLIADEDDEEEYDDKPVVKVDIEGQIMNIVTTVSPQMAIVALQSCIKKLNLLRYPTK